MTMRACTRTQPHTATHTHTHTHTHTCPQSSGGADRDTGGALGVLSQAQLVEMGQPANTEDAQ